MDMMARNVTEVRHGLGLGPPPTLLQDVTDQAIAMRAEANDRGDFDARLALTLPVAEFDRFVRQFVAHIKIIRWAQGLPEAGDPDPQHITFIDYHGVHIVPFEPPLPH